MKREPQEITLKGLRESKGLTQEQICQRLRVSVKTVSNWETNLKTPSFENAIALSIELDVSLKTLAKSLGYDVTRVPNDT